MSKKKTKKNEKRFTAFAVADISSHFEKRIYCHLLAETNHARLDPKRGLVQACSNFVANLCHIVDCPEMKPLHTLVVVFVVAVGAVELATYLNGRLV